MLLSLYRCFRKTTLNDEPNIDNPYLNWWGFSFLEVDVIRTVKGLDCYSHK